MIWKAFNITQFSKNLKKINKNRVYTVLCSSKIFDFGVK